MKLASESLPLSVTPKDLSPPLGWEREGFLIRTATGAWIVDVDPENFDRDEMAEPFARLIAAAPDLLEALLGLVALHDSETRPGDDYAAARAAIAKATGADQ